MEKTPVEDGDTLFHKMTFEEAATFNVLRLYAGDIPAKPLYENQGFIGLSIKQADWNTIKHDITRPFPLKDNTVDFFQAEDVLEHIPYEALPAVFAEIHRILKPGARFRLSGRITAAMSMRPAASGTRRVASSLTRTAAAGTGTESPAAGRTCGSPFSRASRPCAMQARSQRQNFITITTKRAVPSPARSITRLGISTARRTTTRACRTLPRALARRRPHQIRKT